MTFSALRLLIAYLIGGVPIGLMIGKIFRGIDVREFGSGNIGASNVWRTLGPRLGVTVFVLDVIKGFAPVFFTHHRLPHAALLTVLVGIAAILGHNFSPFLKFRGGKGVATSLGVAIGLAPLAAAIGFAAWGLVLYATKFISVSSILGTIVTTTLIWNFNDRALPYLLFAAVAITFVIFTHRSNLKRLRAGTEPKISSKKRTTAA